MKKEINKINSNEVSCFYKFVKIKNRLRKKGLFGESSLHGCKSSEFFIREYLGQNVR